MTEVSSTAMCFKAAFWVTSFFNIFDIYESLCPNLLKDFLFEKPKISYPRLTIIFYANLNFKDDSLVSEYFITKISLTMQDIGHVDAQLEYSNRLGICSNVSCDIIQNEQINMVDV